LFLCTVESKKRKKKLGKYKEMKKRRLNEELVAVTADHSAEQLAVAGKV